MGTNRVSLTIVQMNDTHAYFDVHQEMFWQGDHALNRQAGGYARIASIVKNTGRKPWKLSLLQLGIGA
jgi:S-sulfosulfanyl-L-cysteine sulfohydrolase